jgi:hypothetical protein
MLGAIRVYSTNAAGIDELIEEITVGSVDLHTVEAEDRHLTQYQLIGMIPSSWY